MHSWELENEVMDSLRRALDEGGFLGLMKRILFDEEKEKAARRAAEDLRRKGILDEARELLDRADLALLGLVDRLPERGIQFDGRILRYEGEPVALVDKDFIPIKGQKGRLREALTRILEVREEAEDRSPGLEAARFLGRFWEGVEEGRNDPILGALRNLDRLPEWDPGKEAEERELRRAEIWMRILDELPHIKIDMTRILGLIPRRRISLNPGYEEFFEEELGGYGRNEVYEAMRDLENRLEGQNREKVRALRKEFEKREGIRRNRKLALFTAGILAGAAAGYAFYSYHRLKPVIHSLKIKKLPEKGLAEVTVNATAQYGVARAVIEYENVSYPMAKIGNGTFAYNVSMGEDPLTLPIKVYVFDPYNRSSSAEVEIHWLLTDAFTFFGAEHGVSASNATSFYAKYKNLVEWLYPKNKGKILAPLVVYNRNATLLTSIDERINANSNITNKTDTFLKLSKALYDLDIVGLRDGSMSYLVNLTAYLNESPTSYFSKQQLWNVLNLTEKYPIVIKGLSGRYKLKGMDDFILTYLVNNGYQKVKNYPYLLWALAFKGGYVADLINKNAGCVLPGAHAEVKNFDIMKKYGTNHTYLQLVLEREEQILNASRNGLWLIGLRPKEIIPLAGNNTLTSDLWMLKVSLPFSIISGDALKGDWTLYVYPEIYKNYPEKAALLAFADNINAMSKMQKMLWDYQHNANLRGNWSKKVLEYLNYDSRFNKEEARDLKALWNNGSIYSKMSIFAKSLTQHLAEKYGLTPIPDKHEEYRVSMKQLFGASIGLPLFGGTAKISTINNSTALDGSINVLLIPQDYQLLKNINSSPLMWDPLTRQLYEVITRKDANYYQLLTGKIYKPFVLKWWVDYPIYWSKKFPPDWVLIYQYKK